MRRSDAKSEVARYSDPHLRTALTLHNCRHEPECIRENSIASRLFVEAATHPVTNQCGWALYELIGAHTSSDTRLPFEGRRVESRGAPQFDAAVRFTRADFPCRQSAPRRTSRRLRLVVVGWKAGRHASAQPKARKGTPHSMVWRVESSSAQVWQPPVCRALVPLAFCFSFGRSASDPGALLGRALFCGDERARWRASAGAASMSNLTSVEL